MKRLEKQLSRKANFGRFLQLNRSNFKLKQRERPHSYQNYQKKTTLKGSGATQNQNMFPETISHKKFETNSSFHMKQRTRENFFGTFLLVFTKFLF